VRTSDARIAPLGPIGGRSGHSAPTNRPVLINSRRRGDGVSPFRPSLRLPARKSIAPPVAQARARFSSLCIQRNQPRVERTEKVLRSPPSGSASTPLSDARGEGALPGAGRPRVELRDFAAGFRVACDHAARPGGKVHNTDVVWVERSSSSAVCSRAEKSVARAVQRKTKAHRQ
jgi:hypothetical protein